MISSSGAERMQFGPAIEILERIVRPVVGPPAHETLQVATLVEILFVELATGRHVVGEQLPFEHRPVRRGHRRIDRDGHFRRMRLVERTRGEVVHRAERRPRLRPR